MDSDFIKQLPNAPGWALALGLFGQFLIYGGIVLFVLAIGLWFRHDNPLLVKLAKASFVCGCLAVLGTIGCLLVLFLNNQFEFQYVFSHSDNTIPTYYKFSAIWNAQQGSFLLWATTSAAFGILAFRSAGTYQRWYAATFSVFLGCLCGILAYDSPFTVMKDAIVGGVVKLPHTGVGMTPALQNYWDVIHPPTIFTGFGSLTVMFALAVAAMLSGNAVDWVKIARPWALLSVSVLGLGLCMGGMWAYETQGWGGFWMWDPVEDVSFVPWLFTVALIHGLIVQTTKSRWIGTNLILGGAPFLMYTYGTLLTRSGLLDKISVHSFAEMQHSALLILETFLIGISLAFIVLYIWRGRPLARKAAAEPDAPGYDREGMYRVGVLLLSLLATTIAIAMSWPWWCVLVTGTGKAIEEKQIHPVVVWFFVPIMLLMGIAPFVGWRKIGGKEIFNRLLSILSITAGLTGFALVAIQNPKIGVHLPAGTLVAMPFGRHVPLVPWMAVLIFACMFTGIANLWRAVEMFKRSKLGIGGFVAHIGIAVLFSGLIISRGFEETDSGVVIPNAGPTRILGYSISFDRLDQKSLDDRDGRVLFDVTGPDGQHFKATPGLYYYPGDDGAPTAMKWPYVLKFFAHDFYMAINSPQIFAWDKPLTFQEGQTRIIKSEDGDDPNDPGMAVTYKKFVMQGDPGTVGTTFGAQVHIDDRGTQYDVTPTFTITGDTPERTLPQVGQSYRIAMLKMNAADKSVDLQLMFSPPLYPMVLFYKPMTILVWLGAGLMTLGGLMASFARRRPKGKPAA